MRTRALRSRPELPWVPPARRTPSLRPASLAGVRSPSPSALLFLRGRDADGRLRELEAERARVRPVLGALAARFLDARGSEALGFRSVGDWSRERLGVGARAVREWARVWRRLEALPLLRRAVGEGEVAWSVARLVVSRATLENEADCLATVRGRTLRAVEAILRAMDAPGETACDEAADDGEERVRVRLTGPPELAGRFAVACELARRTAGEALPIWACAEAMAAEAASRWGGPEEEVEAEGTDRVVRGPRRDGADDREHGLRHVVWPHLSWGRAWARGRSGIERLAEGAEACAALELDRRLRAATAFLQSLDLETGRLLRQVLERGLHRELGFESFERYAAERLDLAPRTARRLAALARGERRMPRVVEAFRRGQVTAFQAAVLARVAEGDEARWLDRASRVTLRRLEDDVAAAPRAAIAFLAPPDVAAFFAAMVERVGLAALLDHAIATWLAQAQPGHEDFERDGWRCTVPACTARRNLHSHHIRFRSAGGPDASWNRTTLCAWHHQRGVHAGRIRISGRAPGRLLYELGVGRFRSGDRVSRRAVRSATPARPVATMPIYVSVGHRVTLAAARHWILALAPRHRLPEPIRSAHAEVNRLRRDAARPPSG